MEKEIFEQPEVISQVLGTYLNAFKETLSLPSLPQVTEIQKNCIDRLWNGFLFMFGRKILV